MTGAYAAIISVLIEAMRPAQRKKAAADLRAMASGAPESERRLLETIAEILEEPAYLRLLQAADLPE